MSKYGDDHVCTCEMNLVSCKNQYHADSCELWLEETFRDGSDEWDGDLGCLVIARSPWQNAEEWIWNGDTPVVRKHTATERHFAEAISEWEQATGEFDRSTVEGTGIELIGELEQEVLDALANGSATVDDHGLVCLADGSYADFEIRTTWRRINDGKDIVWAEEKWDDPIEIGLTEADAMEHYTCTCNPPKKYYCHVCKLKRKEEGDAWEPWTSVGTSNRTTGHDDYSDQWYFRGGCTHKFDTFLLPKRQHRNIKISGKRAHGPGTTPDFGLYAYSGWMPDCVAEFIPWQDYGLPTCGYVNAAEAIKRAWDLAETGKVVEVGCMGGHGRTGTILACMALLSDPELTAKAAIQWVRKVHCKEAIETNQQEWYIEWFRCWMLNIDAPAMPQTYLSKHSAAWDAAKKAAIAVQKGDCTHGPLCNGTYSTCESQSAIDTAKAAYEAAVAAAQAKNGEAALPKAGETYHAGGYATEARPSGSWCSHCQRVVYTQHNNDCIFEMTREWKNLPETKGETANARRRNAKRANRRAAQKRKQQARILAAVKEAE